MKCKSITILIVIFLLFNNDSNAQKNSPFIDAVEYSLGRSFISNEKSEETFRHIGINFYKSYKAKLSIGLEAGFNINVSINPDAENSLNPNFITHGQIFSAMLALKQKFINRKSFSAFAKIGTGMLYVEEVTTVQSLQGKHSKKGTTYLKPGFYLSSGFEYVIDDKYRVFAEVSLWTILKRSIKTNMFPFRVGLIIN